MLAEEEHTAAKPDKLRSGTKMAFGVGALAENAMRGGLNNLANPFFNIGLGVSPALLGIGTALFRIFDAFADPVMGWISDRTESRFGRRRPYIVFGALLAGAFFALLWWCPRGMSEMFYVGWFTAVSLLFYLAFTVFGVPYLALGYEISADYNERTDLMSYRTCLTAVSEIGVQWLFWLTQRSCFPDIIEGTRYVGLGVAVVMVVAGAAPAFLLKEKKLSAVELRVNREKLSLWRGFTAFRVRPFQHVLGAVISIILGVFMVAALGLYINVYYVFGGDLKAASTLMGISGTFYNVCCMASVPVIVRVAARIGKRNALLLFIGIAALGCLLTWVCFTPKHPWLQLVVSALLAPGYSAAFTLLASVTADVTDFDELENQTRREGSFSAIFGWTMKVGLAIGFMFAGFVLSWSGFNESLGGAQPAGAMTTIRMLYMVVPVSGLLVAMWFVRKFEITEEVARTIRTQLEARSRLER